MSAHCLNGSGVGLRTQAFTEPNIGVLSVEALMYASSIVAFFARSLGMNLPAFSAQYIMIALDCASVTFWPPGPSLSISTGIWPIGFIARYCGVLCSPFVRSMGCQLYFRPHSSG